MNAMTDSIVPHTRKLPQGVVTMTLDQLVFEQGLPCPTCIKVDVDGLEPAIVDGAARVLADQRVRSVLIEFNLRDALHLQTIDRMTSAGFTKDDATHQKVQQKTTGGNAFVEYQLPEAVLKLKQGFGRLIRMAEDRGTVVILDPRMLTKPYGRVFLESLPPAMVEIEPFED